MKWVIDSSPVAVTRQSRKTATLRSLAAVTRRRGAGWRWGACQGLHPQVRVARGGSSSHLEVKIILHWALGGFKPVPIARLHERLK
ncbi:unnamed protein product [Spirodela intermedia]|uniref:Uncharacterized protein n=1 Tax=Spirodela intermedia TaxID=51605 RepID=A0ABN7E8K8_SPIIN|nr:unnamed protein product [Spirodela intermedia]